MLESADEKMNEDPPGCDAASKDYKEARKLAEQHGFVDFVEVADYGLHKTNLCLGFESPLPTSKNPNLDDPNCGIPELGDAGLLNDFNNHCHSPSKGQSRKMMKHLDLWFGMFDLTKQTCR